MTVILVGLKDEKLMQFESIKVEEFTQNLLDFFAPEIKWEHCTFKYKGMSFGVIYTGALLHKPCICKKVYEAKNPKYSLREGDIFYRYGGRSERIKYTELNAIVENERKSEERMWIDFLRRAAKVGIENACLLDVENSSLNGMGGSILIDENIMSKIAFIREGEFVEKKGKPTLRLIGDIEEIDTGKVVVTQSGSKVVKAIEPENIVKSFLKGERVSEPIEYIKRICTASSANYPIYYFAYQKHVSVDYVVNVVGDTTSRATAKDRLIERLNGKMVCIGKISDTQSPASQKKRNYYELWLRNSIDLTTITVKDLQYCIAALLALPDDEIKSRETYLREKMLEIYNEYYEDAPSPIAGEIRKAICRLDEVLFGELVREQE